METQYQHTENGQEVRQPDINSMSENAALADDRVIWELFRLLPHSVSGPQKAVWTYGIDTWAASGGQTSSALLFPAPAGGAVRVRACRCGVSSLTSGDTLDRVRDIRTGYIEPDNNNGYRAVPIAANVSTNPRWTLVYAKVEPDANGDTADVVKRNVATGNVSVVPAVVINKKTKVTLDTVNGTAATSPTRPALPSDAAGAYYIPLAYLLIPGSFTSSTVLDRQAIYEVAPVVTLNSAVGGCAVKPANQSWVKDGTVDANQFGEDPVASTFRPGAYLPSTMVGGEARVILLQLHLSPASHADGDVVDNSCDWRFRFFKWTAHAKTGNTTADALASDRRLTGASASNAQPVPSAFQGAFGQYQGVGLGQSFRDDTSFGAVFSVSNGHGAAVVMRGATGFMTELGGASDIIMLYVRATDGALVLKLNSAPAVQVFIWLEATGPYSNYGTV